jgi:DNA polymerase III epsilon subunit-like protein
MLFFDIETTGLPICNKKDKKNRYYPPEHSQYYDSSRMVSISWIIYNENGDIIKKEYHIIKPDGFTSHPKALEVHKITNDIAESQGKPIKEVLGLLSNDCKDETTILGYNVAFDYNITLSEAYRYHDRTLIELFHKMNVICIQKEAIEKIENLKCRYKFYPKLEEVIRHIFKEANFTTSHNALDDTFQCAKIYFYLNNEGKIIEKIN